MDNKKDIIVIKTHMKSEYNSIYGKIIYPVAINPLYLHNCCVHEMKIRWKKYSKVSELGRYEFKDSLFSKKQFKFLNCNNEI